MKSRGCCFERSDNKHKRPISSSPNCFLFTLLSHFPISSNKMGGGQFPQATREEMAANRVPLHARDNCAGVLIPLNK